MYLNTKLLEYCPRLIDINCILQFRVNSLEYNIIILFTLTTQNCLYLVVVRKRFGNEPRGDCCSNGVCHGTDLIIYICTYYNGLHFLYNCFYL